MATTDTSRTALIIGASVLACAAIAAPFAVRALHHDSGSDPAPRAVAPTPSPPPALPSLPHDAVRGDVDGDGRDDLVSLRRHDLLRVDLVSGVTIQQFVQDHPRLEGLADIGSTGLAVATASGGHRSAWTLWTSSADRLHQVPTRGSLVLGDEPGFQTTWISGRTLYSGTLDPLQQGADRVAVLARAWTLHGQKLAPTTVGPRCWDRSSGQPPAPCRPGQDWRYDVGPRGDLPALLPADHRGTTGPGGAQSAPGDQWRLLPLHASGDPETGQWLLRYAGQGGPESVRVPVGWAPSLFRSPVRIGDLTDGVLVSQEGGDSDTWRVYLRWGGGIQQLVTRGPVALGGGFSADGGSAYLSWMGPDGRLYTRLGTGRPGRDHVYAWQPAGGSAYTPPVLEAVDLGTVCLDETWQTYGTCAA
jgi:hypothetical protein